METEMMTTRPSSSSSTKIERKVVEKNRRAQMKALFSNLNSLLPNTGSKEGLSMPDQIDEAVDYIKSLEERLKILREDKDKLVSKKRSYCDAIAIPTPTMRSPSPHIEIREMGSILEIILISGLGSEFVFYDMIRLLHEDGLEVVNANFSVVGNSNFHVIHAQIGERCKYGFEAALLTERLCTFINGFCSEVEREPAELWDFEFHPEMWEILK